MSSNVSRKTSMRKSTTVGSRKSVRASPKRKSKRGEPINPDEHPELRKVREFQRVLDHEANKEIKQGIAERKSEKRFKDDVGNPILTMPDHLFLCPSLCFMTECVMLTLEQEDNADAFAGIIVSEGDAKKKKSLLEDDDDNNSKKDAKALATKKTATNLGETGSKKKVGPIQKMNKLVIDISIKLEKKHHWLTYVESLGWTHKKDLELYKIVYHDIIKDELDEFFEDPDRDEGKFDPNREYIYMSCSPFPRDHITPAGIRKVLKEDGWKEKGDYSWKRKYFNLFKHHVTVDNRNPEVEKTCFKLAPLMFVDITMPSFLNVRRNLLSQEAYKQMALKQKEEEDNDPKVIKKREKEKKEAAKSGHAVTADDFLATLKQGPAGGPNAGKPLTAKQQYDLLKQKIEADAVKRQEAERRKREEEEREMIEEANFGGIVRKQDIERSLRKSMNLMSQQSPGLGGQKERESERKTVTEQGGDDGGGDRSSKEDDSHSKTSLISGEDEDGSMMPEDSDYSDSI